MREVLFILHGALSCMILLAYNSCTGGYIMKFSYVIKIYLS
jgi:hypothetical protein